MKTAIVDGVAQHSGNFNVSKTAAAAAAADAAAAAAAKSPHYRCDFIKRVSVASKRQVEQADAFMCNE
jgi:hypothetical protein